MQTETMTLSCTAQELALLAGAARVDVLWGIPDPFFGWLAEEIRDLWVRSRGDFIDRGLLQVGPDGELRLARHVDMLVKACGSPQVSFMVTWTSGAGNRVMYQLHIPAGGLAVEVALLGEEPVLLELSVLASSTPVWNRICMRLGLDGQPAGPAEAAGIVPEAVLSQARRLARQQDVQAASQALLAHGLSDQAAGAFAGVLSRLEGDGSVVALAHDGGDWQINGLGFLRAPEGVISLRTRTDGASPLITVQPATGAEVAQHVQALVQWALSAAGDTE